MKYLKWLLIPVLAVLTLGCGYLDTNNPHGTYHGVVRGNTATLNFDSKVVVVYDPSGYQTYNYFYKSPKGWSNVTAVGADTIVLTDIITSKQIGLPFKYISDRDLVIFNGIQFIKQ